MKISRKSVEDQETVSGGRGEGGGERGEPVLPKCLVLRILTPGHCGNRHGYVGV